MENPEAGGGGGARLGDLVELQMARQPDMPALHVYSSVRSGSSFLNIFSMQLKYYPRNGIYLFQVVPLRYITFSHSLASGKL